MRFITTLLFVCLSVSAYCQSLFGSGPMIGHVDKESAKIWTAVHSSVNKLTLSYWRKGLASEKKEIAFTGDLNKKHTTAIFNLIGLQPSTGYEYSISAETGAAGEIATGEFKTQGTEPYPDFSFLTGSCAANVLDTSIFTTMANTPADIMVWLGDNWYLPNHIDNADILWEGAGYARGQAVMRPLLKAMPHYATWDDHDFGPNNSDKNFRFKKESREAFMDFWANPSYGEGKDGIYTKFSYGDVNFFLLDDRWWRSNDKEPAYTGIRRKTNQKKRMFGKRQLNWLKDELKESKASFNIIVAGSQVLNANTKYDCLYHFPVEYNELMEFLQDNRINGVLFLTGDRHHSEIIRQARNGHYTLYDITVSPFTSGTHKVDKEADNPQRLPGTLIDEKQNFAKVSISGDEGNRKLHIDFLGVKGQKLAEWEVNQRDMSYNK